jgi:hypothetical protein
MVDVVLVCASWYSSWTYVAMILSDIVGPFWLGWNVRCAEAFFSPFLKLLGQQNSFIWHYFWVAPALVAFTRSPAGYRYPYFLVLLTYPHLEIRHSKNDRSAFKSRFLFFFILSFSRWKPFLQHIVGWIWMKRTLTGPPSPILYAKSHAVLQTSPKSPRWFD